MILLDTDILSLIQIGHGHLYEQLVRRLDASDNRPVVVSVVSYEEQMRGWMALAKRARTVKDYVQAMRRFRMMLDDYSTRQIVDFDESAAVTFQGLKKMHPRIGTMDLRIAAIAITHRAQLITRNVRDYHAIQDLVAEDWTAN